jgi:hypothetical protein
MKSGAVLSFVCVFLSYTLGTISLAQDNTSGVQFRAHRIGTARFEPCGVGDFDNNGKIDIVSGEYIYLAPEWKAYKIATINSDVTEEGDGYAWDFMDAPLDVDGDGHLDIVTCNWHGKCMEWRRNPFIFPFENEWETFTIEEKGNYEFGEMVDADGDGVRDEILPICPGVEWAEVGTLENGETGLIVHEISPERHIWGGGMGDINGDGRPDMIRPNAWYEAPEDIREGEWTHHEISLGAPDGGADHTPQILVHDFNRDGRNDLLTSSAHKYGIWWYEQNEDGSWTQHLIDDTWTQAHSHALADLDQDGDLDLLTGKRFRAHNGNDPEGDAPPCVYWYERKGEGSTVEWERHTVSYDEGIGSGMNIPVVDIDADGDLDFVVTGKWGGPVLFENLLK